jgi:PhnB protein
MAVNPIPDGYHTVTPSLVVHGAARLISFLKEAFDAQEKVCMTSPDGRIMHAEVKIGDSMVMMGEASEKWPALPAAICLYVPDTDALYKKALQAGATSVMEPANMFWGDRHAGVKDPTGNFWWILTHVEDVPEEEIKRRQEAWLKEQQAA